MKKIKKLWDKFLFNLACFAIVYLLKANLTPYYLYPDYVNKD